MKTEKKKREMGKIEKFIDKYMPHALSVEKKTGIPALAIMAQAALESAWGEKAIGKNVFGIKFRKGDFGHQEVLTTEYSSRPDAFKGQNIRSIKWIPERNKYQYKVMQYFADYETIESAFLAHSELLLSKRYKHAIEYKNDPKKYMHYIAEAGYATGTNYSKVINSVIDSIKRRL